MNHLTTFLAMLDATGVTYTRTDGDAHARDFLGLGDVVSVRIAKDTGGPAMVGYSGFETVFYFARDTGSLRKIGVWE